MKLLRFFKLQCQKSNAAFCAKQIPKKLNNKGDALPRYQMERFRQIAPDAAEIGTLVPQFL